MRFFSSFIVILYGVLGQATEPVKVAESSVLITELPSDVSLFWRECTLPYKRHIPASRECQSASLPTDQESIQSLELSLIFDKRVLELAPAIMISELQGADEMFLNGEKIGATGNFPPQFEDASFYTRYYVLPQQALSTNRPNTVRLNVYHPNTQFDRTLVNIQLISQNALMQQSFSLDNGLSGITAFLIALTVVAFYHYIRIPNSIDALGLSVFILVSALYVFIDHQFLLHKGLDTNSLYRWKIILFFFAQLALSYFLLKILDIETTLTIRITFASILFLSLTALIWPKIQLLYFLKALSNYTAIIFPAVLVGYAFTTKRKPLSLLQTYFATSVVLATFLFIAELLRQPLAQLIRFEKNTLTCAGLLIISITGCILIIEKYWRYYEGATYDHLTGTLLQPTFLRRLSEEMHRCSRGAFNLVVIMIDIDQFKSINQNYGLNFGDKALVVVAKKLKSTLRQFDLISRISDDEFCVAVTLPSSENVEFFTQRLHDEINRTQLTISDGNPINLKATSAALVFESSRHETPEMILKDLEHALSEAKMHQRGSIQWFDTDNPPLQFIL